MSCVIKDDKKFFHSYFQIMHYMMNKHNAKYLKNR